MTLSQKILNREINLITYKSLNNPYLIKSLEESLKLLYAECILISVANS